MEAAAGSRRPTTDQQTRLHMDLVKKLRLLSARRPLVLNPPEGYLELFSAQPGVEVFVYEANHGFNCDQRGSYNEAAATLARARTLEFFAKHLG
jgi:dienelactone hydrolase